MTFQRTNHYALFLLLLASLAPIAACSQDVGSEEGETNQDLTRGLVASQAQLVGEWSSYGLGVKPRDPEYNQVITKISFAQNGRFIGSLPTTCEGGSACAWAVEGFYLYKVNEDASGRLGDLTLVFNTGPKASFTFSDVRVKDGVLELYETDYSQGVQGPRLIANRFVKAIVRTTCEGCQDVYTSCVAGGSNAASCNTSFGQCIYDSPPFKNFQFAGMDCYPREAKDKVCQRAQRWVVDNKGRAEEQSAALEYSRKLLRYYGIAESQCPLQ